MKINYYLVRPINGFQRLVITSRNGDDIYYVHYDPPYLPLFYDKWFFYGTGYSTLKNACVCYPSQEIKRILKQLLADENWQKLSILLLSIIKAKEKYEDGT